MGNVFLDKASGKDVQRPELNTLRVTMWGMESESLSIA